MKRNWNEVIEEEKQTEEKCMWLSFCDTELPNGSQFLGVIIINAYGIADAVSKAHLLGINPGGQVLGNEIDAEDINSEDMNKLLSREDLEKAGYV